MNRTITSAALGAGVLGGVLLGASSVGTAGAYGDASEADPGDVVETSVLEQDASGTVQVQDTDTPDGEGELDDSEQQGRRGRRGGCGLEAAAEAIGITEADLRAELDAGQSIAEVAEANGVATQAVVDALVDATEERIEAKLADGRISEAEAATKLADAEERAEDKVERVRGPVPADAAA